MKSVLLDTNFILTCIKQKIDFFEEIFLVGMQILIPKQVISEIKNLDNKNSELALFLLKKNKFKEIDFGKGYVDNLILKFAEQNPDVIIATLDRELKNKLKNKKMVIRGKKKLEIVDGRN